MADRRGRQGRVPSLGPNSFISMHFLTKKIAKLRLAPLGNPSSFTDTELSLTSKCCIFFKLNRKGSCMLKHDNSCSDDIHWTNCCRYLELVYPIWHRTHFKMRYIYIAIAFVWTFGLSLNAAYMIPTGKVNLIYSYKSLFLFEWN